MGDEARHKNLLLTGPPGCGKSTIIEKIVRRLSLPSTGFLTREIKDRGRRVGFAITTLNGRHGIMAHMDIRSPRKVGRYGVDVQAIDRFAVPAMSTEDRNTIIVVDEIGKMECCSASFRQSLIRVLESPNPIVGSIALKGDTFITAVKQRPDTRLIPVSLHNRNDLPEELLRKLPRARKAR